MIKIYASNPITLISQSHHHSPRDFSSCGPHGSFWSFFDAPKQRCKTVILWRLWRTMIQRRQVFQRIAFPKVLLIIFIYTALFIHLSTSPFFGLTHNSYICQQVRFFWLKESIIHTSVNKSAFFGLTHYSYICQQVRIFLA